MRFINNMNRNKKNNLKFLIKLKTCKKLWMRKM